MNAKHALRRPFHALIASPTTLSVSANLSTCSQSNQHFLVQTLNSCKEFKSLLQIHGHFTVSGLTKDNSVLTHLISAYSFFHKCDIARSLLASAPNPSVRLCNAVIRAFVRSKRYRDALGLYRFMVEESLRPDKFTFNFAVKACTGALDFQEGVLIHGEITQRKLACDVFIGTSLVDMYCKMGELNIACQVFDRLPLKDIVACNAMIAGFSQGSDPGEALGFFRRLGLLGLEPNSVSLLNLVPAVSRLGDFDSCRSIHGYVVRRAFGTAVLNGLIDMYSKCGDVSVARRVFGSMNGRDEISWGTMMAGYAFHGYFLEVLELYNSLRGDNLPMNEVSIISSLLAAAELKHLEKGKEIHDYAREEEIDSSVRVGTSIMTMYAKCGDIDTAKELFDKFQGKDSIALSAILSSFVQSGFPKQALSLFQDSQCYYLKLDGVALSSILSACADISNVKLGKSIHSYIVKADIERDMSTGTALVSMYAKCRLFSSALLIFNRLSSRDIVAWNSLINACTQINEPYSAMEIFYNLQLSGVKPDAITMVGLVQACLLLKDLHQGTCVHGKTIRNGFECENHVKCSLIGMYAKCGSVSAADFLFNKTRLVKDETSWNVMISGFMQSRHASEAISAFNRMNREKFSPNLVTFVSILPAAADLSALREGMAFHACIIKRGLLSNTVIGNSLIDMYAKCGKIDFSESCFDEMEHKDMVSWNSMLAGYAVHGKGDCALSLFSNMQENHMKADSLSFTSVLSACRHAGLVEEGTRIFHSMKANHFLEPNSEQYECLVDLLGRAGLFDEVMSLVSTMPMKPDAGVWGALLGACRIHSNVELGEIALKHLIELEPRNAGNYVVLSHIYAESGRLRDAEETRSKIKEWGLKKTPGCSWFDVENGYRSFSENVATDGL